MLARAGGARWPRRETEPSSTDFKHKDKDWSWMKPGTKQEVQRVGQSAPTQFQFDPLPLAAARELP